MCTFAREREFYVCFRCACMRTPFCVWTTDFAHGLTRGTVTRMHMAPAMLCAGVGVNDIFQMILLYEHPLQALLA